jgi:hypothetical protein
VIPGIEWIVTRRVHEIPADETVAMHGRRREADSQASM